MDILVDGVAFLLRMETNSCFHALVSAENITSKVCNQVNILPPWKGISRMHDKYLIADSEMYLLEGSLYQVEAYFEQV